MTQFNFNGYNAINSKKKRVVYAEFGQRVGKWWEPSTKSINEPHFGEASWNYSRECRGVTSLTMESGHEFVATRVVPRETILSSLFFIETGFFLFKSEREDKTWINKSLKF